MPYVYYPGTTNPVIWYQLAQATATSVCNSINTAPTLYPTFATSTAITSATSISSWYQVSNTGLPLGYWAQIAAPTTPLLDQREWWETRPTMRELRRPAIIRRENELVEQRARRAMRRSVELYARIRGREEIQRFLHGERVVIQGHRFRYRVTKREDLMRHFRHPHSAHIPYLLEILDPANDNHLASGCIVMEATPVIDQVLAFAMGVQHPERELHILRTTNWNPRLPAPLRLAA